MKSFSILLVAALFSSIKAVPVSQELGTTLYKARDLLGPSYAASPNEKRAIPTTWALYKVYDTVTINAEASTDTCNRYMTMYYDPVNTASPEACIAACDEINNRISGEAQPGQKYTVCNMVNWYTVCDSNGQAEHNECAIHGYKYDNLDSLATNANGINGQKNSGSAVYYRVAPIGITGYATKPAAVNP
ncbi:hypothetical protein ABW21_db0208055 [Orbilia brochopaga]|nr:hypothetical protein ABW21_db0208055 [Drechslerella brochopaga]